MAPEPPLRKPLVEFIGTFFLVLAIGAAAVLGHARPHAGLAIGAVLAAVIYAGGHISAAHYNPAISLAFLIRGRLPAAELAPYIAAQLLAAGAAAAVTLQLATAGAGGAAIQPMDLSAGPGPVFIAELTFTFALAWVILQVATADSLEGNSFYGLAIGAVVVGAVYAVGPISGAALNPAVVAALVFMGKLAATDVAVHLSAELAGAVLAAVLFRHT